MRHFQKLAEGVDVLPLLAEIDAQPELWGAQRERETIGDGQPHREMSDIWVRYRAIEELTSPGAYKEPHIPVWYPAIKALPSLRPLLFAMMALVDGETLGGVLITRIPPGAKIASHVDDGWHVQYYRKLYLSLRSEPGAVFVCEEGGVDETINPNAGDLYLFDNRKPHRVENRSDSERVTLIVCIRTERFGRT